MGSIGILCFTKLEITTIKQKSAVIALLTLYTPSRQLRSSGDIRVFRIPFSEQSPVSLSKNRNIYDSFLLHFEFF